MKKSVIILCNIISLALILDAIDAWHMITMFLFVGIIPGTDSSLTPAQMITLMTVIASIVITKAIILPLSKTLKRIPVKQNRLTAQQLKRA